MKNYILILGAGLMQRPAIEAARELGYKVLLVDANKNALCVSFADRFEPIDLKDREGLLKLAISEKENIAAIFTCGTDFSASVSYVCEKCGLPSHSFASALNASDKVLMRKTFSENQIPSPNFMKISNDENFDFTQIKNESTFPMVIKPTDNMGARGCRLIRNLHEFDFSVNEAIKSSRSGTAIYEEFIDGKEYSIDALVYDGTFTVTGFADRHIFYPPYFIEMGHTLPSLENEDVKLQLINTFANAVNALGLSNGVAKADIKYTKNGPVIGEIAARLSGGYMSGWTFPYASDLNLTKEAMLLSLNEKPLALEKKRIPLNIKNEFFKIYEVPCEKFSAERAFISIPGKVSEIYGIEEARDFPYVKNIFTRITKESLVDFPRNNVEKCGNVITVSEKAELSISYAEKAISNIVIRLESNNLKTQKFLSCEEMEFEKGFPYSAFNLDKNLYNKIFADENSNIIVQENESLYEKFFEQINLMNLQENQILSLENIKDYNYRDIRQTIKLFDKICPIHKEFKLNEFFKCLIRGGIQGILYFSDSIK